MVEVVWVLNLARPVKFSFTDFDRSGSCHMRHAELLLAGLARSPRIEGFKRV